MAKGEAVGPKLILEARPQHAGLDAGGPGDAVDFQDPVEAAQIDGDDTGVVALDGGLHTAHHAGAAAVRDGGGPGVAAPVEEGDHLRLGVRPRDEVRGTLELTAKGAHHVAEGLAVAMPRPVPRIAGADPRQAFRRRHPGCGKGDVLDPGRIPPLQRDPAEPGGEKLRDAFGLLRARPLALDPPTPEFPLPFHRQFFAGASASRIRRSGPGAPSARKGWMQT